MSSSFEFRVFVDKSLGCDKMRRLELLYDTISTCILKGGIPIFWGGDESRDYMYEEDNPNKYSDLPANKTKKLNHNITCVMIQIDENGNEENVPFTISGLDHNNFIVHSKIIQSGGPYIMNIDMTNIDNEDIILEFGIAYACVYGPELNETPKIVVVKDKKKLKCKSNNMKSSMLVYDSGNSRRFKELVKNIEIDNLKNSGHKFYNGRPIW